MVKFDVMAYVSYILPVWYLESCHNKIFFKLQFRFRVGPWIHNTGSMYDTYAITKYFLNCSLGLGLDPGSTTLVPYGTTVSLLSTWVQPGMCPDPEGGLAQAAGKRNCRCCILKGTKNGVRSEQSTDSHNKQNHSSIN
jgi:hypothetical protein